MVCAERKWGVTTILKIISRIRAANVPYVCPYSRRRPNENSSRATAGAGGGEEGTISSLIFLIEHLASGICYSRILLRGELALYLFIGILCHRDHHRVLANALVGNLSHRFAIAPDYISA